MLRFFKAVRPSAGFSTDEPAATAPHSAELFASMRQNGRILDSVRYALGGTAILEGSFKLGKIFPDPEIAAWTLHLQCWPRDVDLRKGLLSGAWIDVPGLISSRDALIYNQMGAAISAADFLRRLQEEEDDQMSASVRWAVVLDDAARLAVQLQGLPASASVLNGRPSLKRYSTSILSVLIVLDRARFKARSFIT